MPPTGPRKEPPAHDRPRIRTDRRKWTEPNGSVKHEGTNTDTTLTVRVDSPEAVFDRIVERFAALDRGENPDPLFESVLQREEDLARLINPNTMAFIRTIARERPGCIRETARRVDGTSTRSTPNSVTSNG